MDIPDMQTADAPSPRNCNVDAGIPSAPDMEVRRRFFISASLCVVPDLTILAVTGETRE